MEYTIFLFLDYANVWIVFCASSVACLVIFGGFCVLFTRLTSTFFLEKTTLKLSPTILFTHLKIILL